MSSANDSAAGGEPPPKKARTDRPSEHSPLAIELRATREVADDRLGRILKLGKQLAAIERDDKTATLLLDGIDLTVAELAKILESFESEVAEKRRLTEEIAKYRAAVKDMLQTIENYKEMPMHSDRSSNASAGASSGKAKRSAASGSDQPSGSEASGSDKPPDSDSQKGKRKKTGTDNQDLKYPFGYVKRVMTVEFLAFVMRCIEKIIKEVFSEENMPKFDSEGNPVPNSGTLLQAQMPQPRADGDDEDDQGCKFVIGTRTSEQRDKILSEIEKELRVLRAIGAAKVIIQLTAEIEQTKPFQDKQTNDLAVPLTHTKTVFCLGSIVDGIARAVFHVGLSNDKNPKAVLDHIFHQFAGRRHSSELNNAHAAITEHQTSFLENLRQKAHDIRDTNSQKDLLCLVKAALTTFTVGSVLPARESDQKQRIAFRLSQDTENSISISPLSKEDIQQLTPDQRKEVVPASETDMFKTKKEVRPMSDDDFKEALEFFFENNFMRSFMPKLTNTIAASPWCEVNMNGQQGGIPSSYAKLMISGGQGTTAQEVAETNPGEFKTMDEIEQLNVPHEVGSFKVTTKFKTSAVGRPATADVYQVQAEPATGSGGVPVGCLHPNSGVEQ